MSESLLQGLSSKPHNFDINRVTGSASDSTVVHVQTGVQLGDSSIKRGPAHTRSNELDFKYWCSEKLRVCNFGASLTES